MEEMGERWNEEGKKERKEKRKAEIEIKWKPFARILGFLMAKNRSLLCPRPNRNAPLRPLARK